VTERLLLLLALAAYAVAAIAAGLALRRRRIGRLRAASIVASAAGLCLQIAFTALRAAATGFLPFASRFESLALFAGSVQVVGLIVYLATRQHSAKLGSDAAGVLLLVGALMPVGFHPGGDLNPILNSRWFAFHILVAFGGYACFTTGLTWSIAALADRRLELNPAVPRRLALAGLFLLGLGILAGAAWADSAWGKWWGWDPKESWALLTWTLGMAGLHLKLFERRQLAVPGFGLVFAAMMFTFIGVNLLRWGVHRY